MNINYQLLLKPIFIGLLAACVTRVSAQTSVVNGGFESGNFNGWTPDGTEPPTISTTAHTGNFSAFLAVTNPTIAANTSEIDQNTFNAGGGSVTPGQVYNFSFWANQVSNDGNGYVQQYVVSFLDDTGAIVTNATGYTPFTAVNGTWTQITANNLTAPPNSFSVYIQIFGATGGVMGGYGGVLIDDVSLTTGSAPPPPPPGQTNLVPASIKGGTQVSWTASGSDQYQPQSSTDDSFWSNLGPLISGNNPSSVFTQTKAPFYRVLDISGGGGGGGTSLLTNGGFETAGSDPSQALDWTVSQAVGGPTLFYGRTNVNPHSGSYDFEVHLAANEGQGPVVTLQQSGIPVTAGTTYPISFYADELTGGSGAAPQWNVQWFGPGFLGQSGFQGYTPGANAYALTTNSVTAPAGTTTATVIFYTPGAADTNQTATIFLDDVTFGSSSGGGGSPGTTNVLSATVLPGVQISWTSLSGTNYQVQSTPSLTTQSWTALGANVPGNGGAASTTDSTTATSKFYKYWNCPDLAKTATEAGRVMAASVQPRFVRGTVKVAI